MDSEDFMAFVDTASAGIGVLMDWTPAHFPNDPHGLAQFDGTHLYDHADPRLGYHPDWHSRISITIASRSATSSEQRLFWLIATISTACAWMPLLDALSRYGRKEGEWIPNQVRRARKLGSCHAAEKT